MKKTSKKFSGLFQKNKDLTSVYIALLALVVIIVIFFLAYLSKMSKVSAPAAPTSGQQVMSGVQTATITILPQNGQAPVSAQPEGTQQTAVQSNLNIAENYGSIPAGSRVKFKIDHFKKLALQPLEFEVFNEGGKAYAPADLQAVDGKSMDFIVVSANLHEFQHLQPEYQDGKWKVLANLPNPGTYYAYTDITPVKGGPVVLRSNLVVQNETAGTITYPGLTPSLFALLKGYKVQLTLNQPLVLQQSVLSYRVTQNGKPVNLNNYLGALGRVTIFRQGNIDSYMRINPLNSGNAAGGLAEFMATFVKGGRYTAFAEFKLGTKVYAFPITFDISG